MKKSNTETHNKGQWWHLTKSQNTCISSNPLDKIHRYNVMWSIWRTKGENQKTFKGSRLCYKSDIKQREHKASDKVGYCNNGWGCRVSISKSQKHVYKGLVWYIFSWDGKDRQTLLLKEVVKPETQVADHKGGWEEKAVCWSWCAYLGQTSVFVFPQKTMKISVNTLESSENYQL